MNDIAPIAMPGTHQSFLKYFNSLSVKPGLKILDMGAGHGAFTKRLHEMGFDVYACDLFPEIFHYDQIECKKADITKELPYDDNTFDLVIAIEVIEHILDHERFFSEMSRILKPKGRAFLSTPNILSLKSRIRFLFNGFFYSFTKLNWDNHDGLQHVASMTLDQYNYAAIRNGFKDAEFEVDKIQKSSTWLYFFFFPLMAINSVIKKRPTYHNHRKLLLGRLLFLNFENKKQ